MSSEAAAIDSIVWQGRKLTRRNHLPLGRNQRPWQLGDSVNQTHRYTAEIRWVGRMGDEPRSYANYTRTYTTRMPGKPDLPGSADPVFRGDSGMHNPEDLFVAAISACHMLSYLALCARRGVEVLRYEDEVVGEMALNVDGSGHFTDVVLRPRVTIAAGADPRLAKSLHATAHEQCFIANSCSVPIRCQPKIVVVPVPARKET